MGILGEIERMVSAGDRGLEIAQDGVHGPERLELDAGLAPAGDFAVVDGASALSSGEAALAIGDHGQGQHQRPVDEVRHGLVGAGQRGKSGQRRLTLLGNVHRNDEGNLVLGSASALATGTRPAKVGVVDLDPAGEPARLLPQAHHLHHLT